MRQSTTIRLDQTVLHEAKKRALEENRTPTNSEDDRAILGQGGH